MTNNELIKRGIAATVKHAEEAAVRRPPKRDDDPYDVVLTAASKLTDDVPVWAWKYNGKGRIQIGTLVLYAGRPGAGKSTCARWKAAGYSNGTLDGHFCAKPVNVAYVAGEESIKYTIKPGLRAAGADLDRIFFPKVVFDDEEIKLLARDHEKALTREFAANNITMVSLSNDVAEYDRNMARLRLAREVWELDGAKWGLLKQIQDADNSDDPGRKLTEEQRRDIYMEVGRIQKRVSELVNTETWRRSGG